MGERGHYFLRLVFPFFVVLFLAISNMHWYLEETDTITPESSNTSQEYEVSEGFQEGIPTNEIKFDLSLNILCYIFNYSEGVSCIESFPFSSDDNSESFSFEEIKTIEYIKLGKTESQTYFVKPVALKLNQDGKILEALDVEENSIKTFLIDRIVGINKEENTKPKLSTRSALKVKYKIHDINFLKTLDNSTFNVINDNLEMKFYSFENALDFSLKNIQYINAITPLKLVDEIKIRQSNLLEILNEFN